MSEYDEQAEDFLSKTGSTIEIKNAEFEFPLWDIENKHASYEVTLIKGEESMTFKFYDSLRNTEEGVKPSTYDILASINYEQEAEESFEDFCDAFGYDSDSIKASKIFDAVKKMNADLKRVFSEEDLELLGEVQ